MVTYLDVEEVVCAGRIVVNAVLVHPLAHVCGELLSELDKISIGELIGDRVVESLSESINLGLDKFLLFSLHGFGATNTEEKS